MIGYITYAFLKYEYVDKKKSIETIAKEVDTYPLKIRRALKKHNIPIRDKSTAQKIALKQGKVHPTKGKQRSATTKRKISETLKRKIHATNKAKADYRQNKSRQ